FVGVEVRATAVDHILPPVVRPGTVAAQRPVELGEQRCTVGCRNVNNLSASGYSTLPQGRQDAHGEKHRTTRKPGDQVERRYRSIVGTPHRMQNASRCEEVDVVPGLRGSWPVLSPASHSGLDQPRISCESYVWSQPESFGDPGTEALHEYVGASDEIEHVRHGLGIIQVGSDEPTTSTDLVVGTWRQIRLLHAHDVCTEVGEHHG